MCEIHLLARLRTSSSLKRSSYVIQRLVSVTGPSSSLAGGVDASGRAPLFVYLTDSLTSATGRGAKREN
jgi:hypothetical protein